MDQLRFSKLVVLELMFNINRKILKKLVIVKMIYIKLISSRYISLN